MVKSKHDDSQPVYKDGGTVYYAQGRYVLAGKLYAGHPKYVDTQAEAYGTLDRTWNWPRGSTERFVDICSQPYWWDAEGKQQMGAAELVEPVSFDAGSENAEIAEWKALTPTQRFARLSRQLDALARSKDSRQTLTASDNAQQLPAEKELTPWQQEALIAERDRQLAVARKQIEAEEANA